MLHNSHVLSQRQKIKDQGPKTKEGRGEGGRGRRGERKKKQDLQVDERSEEPNRR